MISVGYNSRYLNPFNVLQVINLFLLQPYFFVAFIHKVVSKHVKDFIIFIQHVCILLAFRKISHSFKLLFMLRIVSHSNNWNWLQLLHNLSFYFLSLSLQYFWLLKIFHFLQSGKNLEIYNFFKCFIHSDNVLILHLQNSSKFAEFRIFLCLKFLNLSLERVDFFIDKVKFRVFCHFNLFDVSRLIKCLDFNLLFHLCHFKSDRFYRFWCFINLIPDLVNHTWAWYFFYWAF